MALFYVNRFTGDNLDEENEVKHQSKLLLKKLQKEAKSRRCSEGTSAAKNINTSCSDQGLSSLDQLVTDKDSNHQTNLRTKDDEEYDIESSIKDSVGRKRKKHKSTSDLNNISENVSSIEQGVRKKKKHKFKEDDDIVGNAVDSVESSGGLKKLKKRNSKTLQPENEKTTSVDNSDVGTTINNVLLSQKSKASDPDDPEDDNTTGGEILSTSILDGNDTVNIDPELNSDVTNELGGFTILGSYGTKKAETVQRTLPDWLAKPDIITNDIRGEHMAVTDMVGLDEVIVNRLKENGITHFFPVQTQVIPVLLDMLHLGFITGKAGYRPCDLCVSAPTGSGKTLAYVLPIIQGLKNRVCCNIRALVMLPVRDLATQVYKVFCNYCTGTSLKVGLLIGQKTLHIEQQSLVSRRLRGFQSLFDIIVVTPGRLVDHINHTPGFSLKHLRFLVIDEADRIMDEIKQDWLNFVETAINKDCVEEIHPELMSPASLGVITAASVDRPQMPLQKLLFSATLSQNPEKLQELNLFQPKLFTSIVKSSLNTCVDHAIENKITPLQSPAEFVGKYTTPAELTEYFVECTAAEKPLVILHFLHSLMFRRILCFTNSVEATHRLYHVIKLAGGIQVREFSSSLHIQKRNRILQKFAAGDIDIIVCSDAMSRGMDIENVRYVVSYEISPYIKTYIHRIGRTARAGKAGTAITLLQEKEMYHFKKMVREAGKKKIKELKITKTAKQNFVPLLENALIALSEVLKSEKRKKYKIKS